VVVGDAVADAWKKRHADAVVVLMSKVQHIIGANLTDGDGSVSYAKHPDIFAPYPVIDVAVHGNDGITSVTPTGDWVIIDVATCGWVRHVDESDVTIGLRQEAWQELAPEYVEVNA